MYGPPNNEEILQDYARALAEGDVVSQHEIIQAAKYREDLAERLFTVEDSVFASAPEIPIELATIRARAHAVGGASRSIRRLEQWVYGNERGLRAFFRFWPLLATVGFGVCLYLLGRSASLSASRWLVGVAAMFLGSIAVVCASSVWRNYPRRGLPQKSAPDIEAAPSEHGRAAPRTDDQPPVEFSRRRPPMRSKPSSSVWKGMAWAAPKATPDNDAASKSK